MKINFKLLLAALLTAGFLPCALAQVTVVKQDGQKVYLDTSELNRNVSVGETFKIITGREKLTNPKTGKDLGYIYHYSLPGSIIEVQPMYAVGRLADKETVSVGQEAVIDVPAAQNSAQAPKAQNSAAPKKSAEPQTLVRNRKIKTYPILQNEIISAVKADFSALPGEEIAALDTKGTLSLYAEENGTLRPLAQHKLTAGLKPLTLSALDVMKRGRAQIFASVYDDNRHTIYTVALDASDHEFKELDRLPYFAKELGCESDKKIYVQKPFTSASKGGSARELIYENGHFSAGKTVFNTRGNWLSGMQFYPVQDANENNVIYTAPGGKLRLRLHNGKYAESPSSFATAPNRVKYKQDIIPFYPSVQAFGPAGRAVLAAVQNTAKFGLLSESFGSYQSGKIHFLTYENGVLDVRETVELNGFVYDTNCTAAGILVPQVVSGGQTVISEIYR